MGQEKEILEQYVINNFPINKKGYVETTDVCIGDIKFEYHNSKTASNPKYQWIINSIEIKSIKLPTQQNIVEGIFMKDDLIKNDPLFMTEGFRKVDFCAGRVTEMRHHQLHPDRKWLNKDGEYGGKDFQNGDRFDDCKSIRILSNKLAIDESCFVDLSKMADDYHLYGVEETDLYFKVIYFGTISKEKIIELFNKKEISPPQNGHNGQYLTK